MRIKLGSRSSDLARIQAYKVGRELESQGVEVEYIFRESLGDLNPQMDLSQSVEKGVFTQDFYRGLVTGVYDLIVHSWKDLPTEEREGVEVVATLERADMRDVLLMKKGALEKAVEDLKIFSSSPRRAYNLKPFLKLALPRTYKNIQFEPVRGNVQTRLKKLIETEKVHGLVVAKAALDRMLSEEAEEFQGSRTFLRENIDKLNWMVLPLSVNPCAAAQGALALEIRSQDTQLKSVLSRINVKQDWDCVVKEREVLKSFGGGCHQKIGVSVLNRPYGEVLSLQGLTDEGVRLNQFELTSKQSNPSVSVAKEQIYPSPENDKKELAVIDLIVAPIEKDLWIAKSRALPKTWEVQSTQVVWAAGLQTWMKLAQRGVWVNGTSEGLGEQEAENIEVLLGRPLEWFKLSHEGGVEIKGKTLLPTYKLDEELKIPNLTSKSHIFWSSGSQFMQIWRDHAEHLKGVEHACGPGHTYEAIKSVLPESSKVKIFLNREQWWKSLGVDYE